MAVASNRRQRLRRLSLAVVLFAFPVTLYYFSPFLSLAGATQRIVSGSIIVFGARLRRL